MEVVLIAKTRWKNDIQYFNTKFDALDRKAKEKVVYEAIEYLLRKRAASREELQAWVAALINAIPASIRDPLDSTLQKIREGLRIQPIAAWNQEMFSPSNGLSQDFRSWSTLQEVMMLDPAVHELSKAFANRKPEAVVRNFDIIKTIFSDEHAANYSAETRLTAIALLYHIMRSTMHGASEPVQQLVGLNESLVLLHDFYYLP
ncbi:hypothetical protein PCANC_01373 [Puccinia coronata f. sp. avenae]|uniref:Uncharacterized protein n=1 Tax=Puccinia coronata f. sp. avenae TaxID=200324 RepID=A0A2N5W641_9BASI|nr:hypothetical protein PCANC_01373 [Puccinia coronata f. sp. avenae]